MTLIEGEIQGSAGEEQHPKLGTRGQAGQPLRAHPTLSGAKEAHKRGGTVREPARTQMEPRTGERAKPGRSAGPSPSRPLDSAALFRSERDLL